MNHHEHHVEGQEDACCGQGGCGPRACNGKGIMVIVSKLLLLGAFVFSLLTFVSLHRIVREEQVMKAGGEENYERLNKEIYQTKEYKNMMSGQVDMFIKQTQATMKMYNQQVEEPVTAQTGALPTATGAAK